jgi:hypothetical protein
MGRLFDGAMQEYSASRVAAVVDAYDFSEFATIDDVGGGRGSLLAGILKAYPAARGALLDLPDVVADAAAILVAAGVAERCRVVGGSVLERVPSGGDAYILSVVIRDWDTESASALLTTCRRAVPESSRLLTRRARAFRGAERRRGAYLSDLNMLHNLAGRERSETEYRALLAGSGFRLTHPVATQSPFTILEARAGAETPTSERDRAEVLRGREGSRWTIPEWRTSEFASAFTVAMSSSGPRCRTSASTPTRPSPSSSCSLPPPCRPTMTPSGGGQSDAQPGGAQPGARGPTRDHGRRDE